MNISTLINFIFSLPLFCSNTASVYWANFHTWYSPCSNIRNPKDKANCLKTLFKNIVFWQQLQKHIQNPYKHLRWSLLQNYFVKYSIFEVWQSFSYAFDLNRDVRRTLWIMVCSQSPTNYSNGMHTLPFTLQLY